MRNQVTTLEREVVLAKEIRVTPIFKIFQLMDLTKTWGNLNSRLSAILVRVGSQPVEFYHLKRGRIPDIPADQLLSVLANPCYYLIICLAILIS